MNAERELFQGLSPEAEAAADARAMADFRAGRGVPHEEVAKWLAKWGTPEECPIPPEWLE